LSKKSQRFDQNGMILKVEERR